MNVAWQTEAQCRPKTSRYFWVENSIVTESICADIRHFGWDTECEGWFETSSHYVDLALVPRVPGVQFIDQAGVRRVDLGDAMFLPKGTGFRVRSTPRDYSFFSLTLRDGAVSSLFDQSGLEGGISPHLDLRQQNVRAGLARLAREVRRPGFAQVALVESLTMTLVVDMCRHLREEEKLRDAGALAGWRMRRIRERVAALDSTRISIADLAAECRMSPRHLMRTFKASMGLTLADYLASVRIDRAKRELLAGTMIKVVAARSGFRNAASFSAAFRRQTGFTPKAFRAAHKLH